MSDNLDRYVPEFDDDEAHDKLASFGKDDLLAMLVRAYKEKRVLAKMVEERDAKLDSIRDALEKPSALLASPGVPNVDDLNRMSED